MEKNSLSKSLYSLSDERKQRFETVQAILSRNINATDELLDAAYDCELVDSSQIDRLKKLDNEARMMYLLNSIANKDAAHLESFCDILVLLGHPILATFLLQEVLEENGVQAQVSTILETVSELNLSLTVEDSNLLERCLTEKLIEIQLISSLVDRQERNKEYFSQKKKHVEETWKYLRKTKELSKITKSLEKEIQNLKTLINKKDKEIQRMEESMEIVHKSEQSENEILISHFNQAFQAIGQRLSSFTDTENAKQLEATTTCNVEKIDKTIHEFYEFCDLVESLEADCKEYKLLKSSLANIIKTLPIFTPPVDDESTTDEIMFLLNSGVSKLAQEKDESQEQVELLTNILNQRLPQSRIPDEYSNVSLPLEAKQEMEREIELLNEEIQHLNAIISTYKDNRNLGDYDKDSQYFQSRSSLRHNSKEALHHTNNKRAEVEPEIDILRNTFTVTAGKKYPILKPIEPNRKSSRTTTSPVEIPHSHRKKTKREPNIIIKREPAGTAISSKTMDFGNLPVNS